MDVNLSAVLITSDGHQAEVRVKDLSTNGFRVELAEEVIVGERVILRAGKHGDLIAEIKWALGSEAGGQFLDEANETYP